MNYSSLPYRNTSVPASQPLHVFEAMKSTSYAAEFTYDAILEVGCGCGANAIRLAKDNPNSAVLAIDQNAEQIKIASETENLPDNLSFQVADLESNAAAALGEFDYVVAHGVYSWIERPVLLLKFIQKVCTGTAFVSFCTYPGSAMKMQMRDLMLMHLARFEGEEKQIKQARSILKYIGTSNAETKPDYSSTYLKEFTKLLNLPDWYLAHDHLEASFVPVYFRTFWSQIDKIGFDYVADADINSQTLFEYPPEVEAKIRAIAGDDRLMYEQYADHVRNREFRQAIIHRRQG